MMEKSIAQLFFGVPIPIFRSCDQAACRAFNIGVLDMQLDWEHRLEPVLALCMQVSPGVWPLHLSEHFGDATPGSQVRVEVSDVVAYCAQLNAVVIRRHVRVINSSHGGGPT